MPSLPSRERELKLAVDGQLAHVMGRSPRGSAN